MQQHLEGVSPQSRGKWSPLQLWLQLESTEAQCYIAGGKCGQVENYLWSIDLVLNATQHERPVTGYDLSGNFHLDGSEMSPRKKKMDEFHLASIASGLYRLRVDTDIMNAATDQFKKTSLKLTV